MCYSRLLDGVSKITNIRNALDDHLKGKQPFSSGPDGDHPAGEIDGSVLIEPTVHLSTIQKVLDLTTQNSTPIHGLAEKLEYLSEPNI